MSSQYGKLRPINGWDLLASLGHPSKFQRVSRLAFVTAVMSLTGGQPNFAWCLSISWAGISIYTFWGALAPNRILPAAKFTLHLSLAFAYIGSVTTAQLSSSGRQQNFAALSSERHLRSAGWPSRWASAHILVLILFSQYWSRTWLGRASSKWPTLCGVGCKTLTSYQYVLGCWSYDCCGICV